MKMLFSIVWFLSNMTFAASAAAEAVRSGAGKYLDVHSPCQGDNGCNVQVWDCNGTRQQTWSAR